MERSADELPSPLPGPDPPPITFTPDRRLLDEDQGAAARLRVRARRQGRAEREGPCADRPPLPLTRRDMRALPALNKLVEATRRVAHDKGAWRQAANVAARCAAAEAERLTRRAEKAEGEAELLRVQVTTLRSGLESEKARSAKQLALAAAATMAANKRASQFEALYEQAKADASEERRRVEARARA